MKNIEKVRYEMQIDISEPIENIEPITFNVFEFKTTMFWLEKYDYMRTKQNLKSNSGN